MSQDLFSLLLQDALKHPEPQMMLFVFARVVLADDATDEQRIAFENGEGGKLRPISCVKKLPTELTDFNALSDLSGQNDMPWDVVFIASINKSKRKIPTSDKVGKGLKKMIDSVRSGQVGQFLALNRQGERLSFD